MKGTSLKSALASCRRVLLLLLLILAVAATWLYIQSPTIDAIRPHIESYLKQELKLKEIKLGELSWNWAGFLWLQAESLDFTSDDESLAFHDGKVAVRIALSKLLSGDVSPDRIRLIDGSMDIDLDVPSMAAPTEQLMLDNVEVNWSYHELRGKLEKLHLTLEWKNGLLQMMLPAFKLSAHLDQDGLPQLLKLECSQTSWLPESMQQQLHGGVTANIAVKRMGERIWQLHASASSETPFTLFPAANYSFSANKLELQATMKAKNGDAFAIERIDIERAEWALADSHISAAGNWNAGLLSLQAISERLSMPVMWSWLRPLDDEADWLHWLSLMKTGFASDAKATVSLVWDDPLQAWPTMQAFNAMLFQVSGLIEESDIAFGISEDSLQHASGRVELDQNGLKALFEDGILPRGLGHVTGELYIPWQTLELHIKGKSKVDVASLIGWFGPADIAAWQWNGAKADGSFQLLWDPSETEPREASAELYPSGKWDVSIRDIPLNLSNGVAVWNQRSGLKVSGVQFHGEHMSGLLSLFTSADEQDQWQIRRLDATAISDFAMLAAHFQLPVSDASGTIKTSLKYDEEWRGEVDLTKTSWQHLIGSSKKMDAPYVIQYLADLDLKAEKPTVELSKLHSIGKALLIRNGQASINQDRLTLNFKGLHTPSYSGSLDIHVPFDEKPWQLISHARYLNRNALPDALDHPAEMVDKSWLITADIEQFDWDDARMQGVAIKLASAKGSIGQFKAKKISATQLNIKDADVRFSLPGGGAIDLRRLSAKVEKQQLTMSATLKPEASGGMRWRGFAELHGDFGQLMKLGELSERFEKGEAKVLFSGSGLILHKQPWWQGLDGRIRMRADEGRILEGGAMTKLLAAVNLSELPMLLLGQRKDLSGPGIMFDRLQMEAIINNQDINIRNVVLRSSAFDLAGQGNMDLQKANIDLYLIVQPLQNLDALLSKIPLLRDILGGSAHSFFRKIYHMHGSFADARVDSVKAGQAGAASPGLVEHLLSLPNAWFGSEIDSSNATTVQ